MLGPVMTDVEGTSLSTEDKQLLNQPLVGGVILFSRNFESAIQLQQLVNDIKLLRDTPLLVAVDHEGGRVQRFKDPFTKIPALRNLGDTYNQQPQQAIKYARTFGWLTAIELLSFNIDFSFTPVLDIDYGLSQVIGDRAFHNDPNVITKLAAAYIDGLHQAGMSSTGKHFPGHGGVEADSHIDIPIDGRSFDTIRDHDMLPFTELIPDKLDAIMPAHVIYEKVVKQPAGFSNYWLKTMLRKTLKFEGVIFSDDLDMKGASIISENYTDRAKAALNAGCDMVLVCNNRAAAIDVITNLKFNITKRSHQQLLKMRRENVHQYEWATLTQLDAWKQAIKVVAGYK